MFSRCSNTIPQYFFTPHVSQLLHAHFRNNRCIQKLFCINPSIYCITSSSYPINHALLYRHISTYHHSLIDIFPILLPLMIYLFKAPSLSSTNIDHKTETKTKQHNLYEYKLSKTSVDYFKDTDLAEPCYVHPHHL